MQRLTGLLGALLAAAACAPPSSFRPDSKARVLQQDPIRCKLALGRYGLTLVTAADGAVAAAFIEQAPHAAEHRPLRCLATIASRGRVPGPASGERVARLAFDWIGGDKGWSAMEMSGPADATDAALARETMSFALWADDADQGWAFLAIDDGEAAAPRFREAVRKNPDDGRALRGLAHALASSGGDAGEARKAAERAVQLDPAGSAAHEALLRACLAAGDDECTLREWDRARLGRDAAVRTAELTSLIPLVLRAGERSADARDDHALAMREKIHEQRAGGGELARMPPPLGQPTFVDAPGGLLRVDDGGPADAPAAILVHGLGGSSEVWAFQLAHLREAGLRAVAFDLRGHGRSASPLNGIYSVESLGDDIGRIADSLGVRRFVLVGHALGATIAASYAARFPERVVGLVLVDPLGDLTRAPAAQLQGLEDKLEGRRALATLDTFFHALLRGAAPGTRAQVLRPLHRASVEALSAAMGAAVRHSPAADLQAFRGPAVALVTDFNDEPFGLPALVPALRLERAARVSHWAMLDAPEAVDDLIEELADGGGDP